MTLFNKKNLFRAGRLFLAAGLIVWLIAELRSERFRELDPGNIAVSLLIAGLLMCLQVSFGAWRWTLLLKAQGIELSLFRAVSLSFQGSAFSFFLPGGALGGDVVKAAILAADTRRGKKVEGITTVALDRLIGMSALFLIVLGVAAFGFERIRAVDPAVRAGIYLLLALCLIGVLIVGSLFFQDLVFRVRGLDFLRRKADALLGGKVTRVLEAISLYRKERLTLFKAFLISLFFVHPFLLSALFVILWGIRSSPPDFTGSYLAISLGNSAAVLPVTIGGLGTRDKIAQVVLKAFGTDPQSATLAPLCFSLMLVLVASIGLFFFAADALSKHASKKQADASVSPVCPDKV